MDKKILQDVGLTPKELDVYMVLLESDFESIANIMTKAKISRKSIYEILDKLLDKGLVSYTIKDNKKQFSAVTPERFLDILKEKEQNVQNLLPVLLKKYSQSKEETIVRVFLGKEGMKTASQNLLKEKKNFYVIANEGKIFDFLKYYMPQFQKNAKKNGMIGDVIYSESARDKKLLTPKQNKIRYSPDKYTTPMSTVVYGENINILIFSEDNPITIHIKNKHVANSFKTYFNLMWAISKE
ncbi:MAG: hypothetical protein KAI53_02675 [Candidatus Aenigmarchaeota archaeon]|nr:hypothetical protein [Candidatus Aenigmarchaeota archaeon]